MAKTKPDAASSDRVTFTFDGEPLFGRVGDPAAATLAGAGKLSIARSPKFHRPRGPSCFRGACDGCLARVDGEPNVLLCMTPVRAGMIVESQNTLGTRNVDLLRVTDWFFSEGMNHHELFAGVPGISGMMQAFARRVAGLGRLPKDARSESPAKRRAIDVLVVGAGVSGLAVASELARAGRHVEVLDDAITPGGGARSLAEEDAPPFMRVLDDARAAGVTIRSRATAGGVFGDDVLVVSENGAEVLTATDLVLAPGAHDGVLAFEGNDVPGVMSARALGLMLRLGIVPGDRICIVKANGAGIIGDSVAKQAEKMGVPCDVVVGEPSRVRGTSRAKSIVVVNAREKEIETRADIVALDAAPAPAYELSEQAGAALVHTPAGYVVKTERGKIRDGVWALGEACGTPFEAARLLDEAKDVARAIQSSSSGPKSAMPPKSATASNVPSKTK